MSRTRIIIEDIEWCDSYWEAPCPYGCNGITILVMDDIWEHPDYDDGFVYYCFGCGKPIIFEKLKNRARLTVRLSCKRPPQASKSNRMIIAPKKKKAIPFMCPKCGMPMTQVDAEGNEWLCEPCPYHYKRG